MPHSVTVPVRRDPNHAIPVKAYLVESSFLDPLPPDEEPDRWDEELELDVQLLLYRHSLRKMTVALSVSSTESSPVDFVVVYACDFVLSEGVPTDAIDDAWENLAFSMAPPLLYAYVRAELFRLTAHSRAKDLVLPFLPMPIQRPPDFQLPEPPDRGVQRELPPTDEGDEAEPG